jgi:hypothetical protein
MRDSSINRPHAGRQGSLAPSAAHKAKSALVTVGDGRGFVVTCRQDRLVLTAAHCLPYTREGQGWVLSLEQKWSRYTVEYMKLVDGPLWICNTAQPIVGGMSGSPVISDYGAAIGIVATSTSSGCEDQYGSKNPRLASARTTRPFTKKEVVGEVINLDTKVS